MTPRRPRARRREVIVFTEGEATEVSYIDAIKRLQDSFVVRVDDRHGDPGFLVPLAIAHKQRLSRLSREEGAPAGRGKRVTLVDVAGRYPQAREQALRLRDQHERDGVVLPTQRDPSTDVWELVDALGVAY